MVVAVTLQGAGLAMPSVGVVGQMSGSEDVDEVGSGPVDGGADLAGNRLVEQAGSAS